MGSVKAFFAAVAALCGWGRQRDAELNTPDMKAGAEGADDQKQAQKTADDIAKGDTNEVRKDLGGEVDPKFAGCLALFFFALFVIVMFVLSGCGTVYSKDKRPNAPTYSGTSRDSGVLPVTKGAGYVPLTESKLAQYNDLAAIYGCAITLRVKPNDGVTRVNGEIRLDAEHAVKFGTMLRWAGRHKAPPTVLQKLTGTYQ